MSPESIFLARYRTCLANLAAEVARLVEVTDPNKPFRFGEDVRANHRRMVEHNLAHWSARLDENIRAIAELETA